TASSASSQNTSGSFELVIQTGDVGNGVSYAGSSGSIRIDVKDGGAIRQALRVGANNSGGFVQTGNTSNTGYNFRIVDINNVEYVRVDPANGQTLFNSGAANIDFRVMSDNFSHIFHIDAAEDQVQIGNLSGAAPRNILTLYHGDADGNDGIQIVRNDTSVAENDWLGGIGFDSRDGNTPSSVKEASAFIGAYAAQNQSSIDKGGYMVIGTSAIDEADDTVSTERLRIGPDSLVQVSGSLRIRDDLVVGSNIIRASDGGSTITMDTSDNVQINGKLTVRGDTAASDAAAIGYTASEGIVITGLGSLKDVTIKNQNDAEVISVKAATTSVNFAGDIVVGGNQIKASDGGVTITLDTSDNVTIGNDLTVGGNVIRASDGGATITMDTSDNVTIGGSLTVTGGVIDTTGNLVIDASNEINLDAAGNVINFQDDGSTRYTFNLSPTPELDVAGNFTIDVTGDMTIDCSGGDLRFRNGGNFMGKITMPDPSTTVANGSFVGQSMGYTAFPGHVYTHLAGSSVGAGTSPYNGKYMLAAHSFLHKADGTYRGTNGANAPQSTVYTTRNPQDIGNHYNGASSTSPSNNEHLVTPQTAYSVLLNNADSVKV
ncbi:MAG: hypothetical protein VXY53_06745, partial [Candidatus Thermoplasmatota archaeon]|nr:hypothetical protein [Candidatus Thermoplasmatota archaeon]